VEEAFDDLGDLDPVHDAFGELHDAFLADVLAVAVAPGARVDHPVVIVHLAAGAPAATFPRLRVSVGASAEAGVIEVLASTGEGTSLVVPVTELDVADGARLAYACVQLLGPGALHIGTQASRVGSGARLRSFTAGFGGAYDRVRTDCELVGQGGESSLQAAYLGTGDQVHDFRTLQDHRAARTRSELLFEGAVADHARSVYSGLIRIHRGARGADAFQTNHNLVLSEGAHADSVPNLDILENDVKCSHASTVGPIDEDQRYYIESRGVAPEVAEGLIVRGFFDAIIDRGPVPALSPLLEREVHTRLGAALDGRRMAARV
jgi:Fe-S cluster assembly protein SufD